MRELLYIGNKLEKHGAAPTSVDILPYLLEQEGYKFKTASSIKNKAFRLLHMLFSVLKNTKDKDLVLIDTYSTSNFWYAVLCGQLCNTLTIPYIFILHGGNLKKRFDKSSSKVLDVFYKAKSCVVPSNFLMQSLKNYKFNNLRYIPNSINLTDYKFKRRNLLQPRLLWVRAFDEVYNPSLAIEVLEILIRNGIDAKLCMVGPEKDGSLKETKFLAKEKDLPVIFTGKLDKKEWIELSQEYDIFLNTTSVDNTPVSLIEAMALGIPIVTTNVGGIPFLIEDEQNGILVEPGNASAMVEAIEKLLHEPELSERLSVNGRNVARNHDWKQVKHFWLELLG